MLEQLPAPHDRPQHQQPLALQSSLFGGVMLQKLDDQIPLMPRMMQLQTHQAAPNLSANWFAFVRNLENNELVMFLMQSVQHASGRTLRSWER